MAQPTYQDLINALGTVEKEWDSLLTHRKLSFAAEREWFLQACDKSDTAKECAIGNMEAACAALRNVAAVGVTLDPARKLAYILPRDGKMVYDLSYMGLIDVAITSGAILWAQAAVVHDNPNETFELLGYDEAPKHKRDPFAKDRGPVKGAYVVVKTPGGDYLTGTLAFDEIESIRMRSPSGKKGSGPWKSDWDEMAKKSVVKNSYKYWPRSEALDRAIHYLNTDGGQGIDLTPEAAAKSKADAIIEDVKAATSGTAVATVWQRARTDEELKADPDAYARVREAVAARNRELGVQPKPTTGPVATPAPSPSPAPSPAPAAESPEAALLRRITTAPDYAALDATGPDIDALPADLQAEFNDAYNQRLEALKKGQK